jgi:mono/diheme cytochrome c family protein
MSIRAILPAVLLAIAAGLAACDKDKTEQLQLQKVTYADDVDPILQKHCAECHVAGQQGAEASGLLMDSYESVMKGTRFGSVIKPGSANTSSLYILVAGKGNLTITMPHGKDPLSAEEIETIRVWIEDGAVEN